jgi:hypothetical protein
MEWVNINTLTIDSSDKRTLNQILEKERELDPTNVSPLKIDLNGKILDGVKRYLVLIKWEFTRVPVIRESKSKKVKINYAAKSEESFKLAA